MLQLQRRPIVAGEKDALRILRIVINQSRRVNHLMQHRAAGLTY